MRRFPAPVLPPPPPKPPKLPASPSDCPKFGDSKLPTGVPRFTRLKRFWKLIETFRLNLFSLGALPDGPPCGPAPAAATLAGAPPPPPPPAAIIGPPPGPPAARFSPPPELGAAACP